MKKLLLAAVLIAASISTFAATNTQAPLLAEKSISLSIRSQIQFPDCLRERDGEHDATITFRVNTCGTISVQDIETDDEELKADLMTQAPGIKVDAAGQDSRDIYKVVVRFKTL